MKNKAVLGICSSISIYKSCEIIRLFQKADVEVQPIMTRNATKLISPLLASALSGFRAVVDPYEENPSEKIDHISLAKEADLFCVAPATANMIAKFASGVADDFMSTFYLAVRSPVLIAPAMNEAMFLHSRTQENIRLLKSTGIKFIEPGKGYLACRDQGWGRLADPEDIVEEALRLMRRSRSLEGKKVLVTAGPTREYMDPVRYLTNRSSGKMGYALAEEAASRSASVVLISGPTYLYPPADVAFEAVETSHEMEEAVSRHVPDADIIIMAAAVSDFTFPGREKRKIKKGEAKESLEIVPTADIIAGIGRTRKDVLVVGFAAETEEIEKNAATKLKAKNLDLIVANDVAREDVGFDSNENQVSLIFADGRVEHTAKKGKREIAADIINAVEDIIGKKGNSR